MGEALRLACDINDTTRERLVQSLQDVAGDEINWRAHPQANTINIIVRHLRIEAEWHLRSLEHGEPLPTIAAAPRQEEIETISLNFQENYGKLLRLLERFSEVLRSTPLHTLHQRSTAAYGEAARQEERPYRLAYHQAIHIATHIGQIRMIRNLYCKARGEPARFLPENPTYPH